MFNFRYAAMCLIVAVLAASACVADSAPAPLSQRNPGDPKNAVENFLRAVQSSDNTAIAEALSVAPESRPAVDTFLQLIFASNRLQAAAQVKFGTAGNEFFGTAPASQLAARLKALQDAPIKIVGDSALINMPADEANKQSGGTIIVEKMKDGTWKLNAASLFNLNNLDKKDADRRVALAAKLLPITEQATADISAGKFTAAREAYEDFWTKSLEAMKAVNPPPATAPAPATQK